MRCLYTETSDRCQLGDDMWKHDALKKIPTPEGLTVLGVNVLTSMLEDRGD